MKNYALITGASSGIGRELAEVFAKEAWNLILVARSVESLVSLKKQLESQYGIDVKVIPKDLSVEESCEELFSEIQADALKVEVLVNNAGHGDYGLFHQTSWARDRSMIQVNMLALTKLTKLFLPNMIREQRGYILNVASTAAFQAGPYMAVYYATKAYVLSFTEAIANETADSGVKVTALCPGPTASNFFEAAQLRSLPLLVNRKLPSARDVAHYGYHALMKGHVLAIHGRLNYLLAGSVRFAPRRLATAIVRKLQGPKS